jgi:hypothetical protein
MRCLLQMPPVESLRVPNKTPLSELWNRHAPSGGHRHRSSTKVDIVAIGTTRCCITGPTLIEPWQEIDAQGRAGDHDERGDKTHLAGCGSTVDWGHTPCMHKIDHLRLGFGVTPQPSFATLLFAAVPGARAQVNLAISELPAGRRQSAVFWVDGRYGGIATLITLGSEVAE